VLVTDRRLDQLFRLAAHSLHRSPTPLGDFLRRMKARLGPEAATTATAHKIAIIFYTMVRKQVEYDKTLWAAHEVERDRRLQVKLRRQARRLGYELVPVDQAPAA
jgi:transposase